jgi:uncharacterized membrane protein HdeD (DUF308 family)
VAAGAVLLAWPGVTLFVVATVMGGWVALRSVAAPTIIVATRADRRAWVVVLVVTVFELSLGIVLIARAVGGLSGTAMIAGATAALEGGLELAEAIARHRGDQAMTLVFAESR